ncbi:maleylpyruvate isomerase family mycothiol-dependent enzyme [soil metagenome]
MPQHPAAPEELVDLIEGYRQAMRSMIDLGRSCPEGKADAPTPCPGWSVKDQFAHIASLEIYFDGGEYAQVELPERGHLNSDFAEWMEYGVQARRDRSLPEIVDELETLLFNRLATLGNPELTVDSMVRGPMDKQITLADLMERRLVDIWVHEQDAREALGRIGNLDSPAAATFVSRIVNAFSRVVERRLDLQPGMSVIVESTGPVTARMGVRMAYHDSDERVVAHPLFTGATEPEDSDAPAHSDRAPDDVASTVTITMTTDALTRRSAGRRSTADTTYKVVGDEEIARAVLDVLVITP